MKPGDCLQQSETLAAARSGRWSPALRSHLEGCAGCAETAIVAQVLQGELCADNTTLPSAGQVWWRAQIRARRMDFERATRPVRLVQTVAAACAVLSLVLLLLPYLSELQQWLLNFSTEAANLEQRPAWIFFATSAMFVAAVSAGLGYMRRSSK